jgi:pimeloyl-ACP methyl ester carboxylesterase
MATFVLVHGAYQGGWIWKPVAERLRKAGHAVHVPTLDGCAERHGQIRPGITIATHAEEVAKLLFYEDLRDVVLVGTSSGGMVIVKAAELAADRIARLVFVDALALLPGERIADIVNRPTPTSTDVATGPSRQDAEGRMFADLDPTTRAWALARYTLHPIAAMNDPMVPTTFWDRAWPGTTVIRCRRAANPPETHQRRTAERLKAKYLELDTGHYPMLSQPDELTRMLVQ